MAEHTGSPTEKYWYLEQLSTERLEALLTAQHGADADTELLDAIVEVMIEREKNNPTGRLPDIDTAWNDFQTYYNTPDGEGKSLFPEETEDFTKSRPAEKSLTKKSPHSRSHFSNCIRRFVMPTAVSVAATFVILFGIQASGIDIFGSMAKWTNDTFQFAAGHSTDIYDALQKTLSEWDIGNVNLPHWYPKGAELASIDVTEDSETVMVWATLKGPDDKTFFASIDRYNVPQKVDSYTFEIDTESVEEYISDSKLYYIFTNTDSTTVVWADDTFLLSIWGDLTVDEIKGMINSIGG